MYYPRKMKLIKRYAGFVHTFRRGHSHRIKKTLEYLWRAYSKPTPVAAKEVLTVLFLCFAIAVVTGALFFRWMSEILKYDQPSSATVASLYTVLAFFLLFLVHPARCAFTIILPTLGTKQGRKLILSTAIMLLALNVIPNIVTNVAVVAQVLKCTAGGLAQSLINSSELVNRAKEELVKEAMKASLDITPRLREFDHDTNINVSEVKQKFVAVSQCIENDISSAKNILEDTKLVSNRLLAVFLVVYLFCESACYLNAYLTNVKFDNKYITGQLVHMACENGIQILPDYMKNMVYSSSYRISKQEFLKCILRLTVVSLYFVATVFIVALDYTVYHLVKEGESWLLDTPSTSINLSINYKVQSYSPISCIFIRACGDTEVVNFQQVYTWNFSFGSEHCVLEPNEPNMSVTVILVLLYLLAYAMVLLEVYARRVRRKVAASFFERQERKRIDFIFKKIMAKQEKHKKYIFFIDTTHSSGVCNPDTSGAGYI